MSHIKLQQAIDCQVAKGNGNSRLVKLARKVLEAKLKELEPVIIEPEIVEPVIEQAFRITVMFGRSGEKHHPAICTKVTHPDGRVEYTHIMAVCNCAGSRQGCHMTVSGESYALYNCRKK